MIHRRVLVPVVAASLFLAACRSDPPPPPEPVGPTAEELERMRQDSIAAAMRQDSIRRAAEADAAAAEAREASIRAARATLEETIYFDYDEAAIRSDAERVLRQKMDILRNSPAVQVRIEGHADERGSTEYNIALGNRRAESVRQFLTGFGLDAGRFAIVSYGEERPQAQGSDESAWAQNRRAEFVITAGADQIVPPQP
jgi:peptidoglycan-associated lipoprotein